MRLPLILISSLLLAACSQPAPPPAAADAPPPMDASAPATAAAPAGTEAAPPPMTGTAPPPMTGAAPPAMTGAAPAAAGDGQDQGNARQRIGQLLGDVAPYETVFNALQKGVAAHDAKAVAALPVYPLRVNVGGKERRIADAATFEREYDSIITADIGKAIAAQKFDDLFVNGQGVMIGAGQVWINGICADKTCAQPQVGIVAIQQ